MISPGSYSPLQRLLRICLFQGHESKNLRFAYLSMIKKSFSRIGEGSSVPLSCFVTQPLPWREKKNEKTWARCCILDYFFLFIPEKKNYFLFLCWFLRLAYHSFMLSDFFLHVMGPASYRHNNPSNQLPQHLSEIESAHSPH